MKTSLFRCPTNHMNQKRVVKLSTRITRRVQERSGIRNRDTREEKNPKELANRQGVRLKERANHNIITKTLYMPL